MTKRIFNLFPCSFCIITFHVWTYSRLLSYLSQICNPLAPAIYHQKNAHLLLISCRPPLLRKSLLDVIFLGLRHLIIPHCYLMSNHLLSIIPLYSSSQSFMLYLDLDRFLIAVEEERRPNRKCLRLLPSIYKSLLSSQNLVLL